MVLRYYPGALEIGIRTELDGVETRVFRKMTDSNRGLFKVIVDGKPTTDRIKNSGEIPEVSKMTPIIVNTMQDADPSVGRIADTIARHLGIRPNINMYTSPPHSVGLTAHHDPQDVFVIQVSGSKTWLVCDPIGPGRSLPTRVSDDPSHDLYYRYSTKDLEGATCREYELNIGDILYMPRGTIHAPATHKNSSVHLTVGIDGDFTWGDFFKGVARSGGFEKPRESLSTLFTCLPQRDLNRLVPHLPLWDTQNNRITLQQAQLEFSKGVENLGWGKCPLETRERLLRECLGVVGKVVDLMLKLQVNSRSRKPKFWT